MHPETSLPKVFKEFLPIIENSLQKIFLEKNKNILEKSMAYSALAKGKRIRPVLALCAYKLFGKEDYETIATSSCALELIHAYSLVHDDLPAMDNDDLRRGVPTNHKVFGDAIAILAGDALQTLGIEMLALYPEGSAFRSRRLKALKVVLSAIGREGMALGQAMDIEEKEEDFDEESLLRMHFLKTGRLIEASLLCGGIWAGAKRREIKLLSDFGKSLGILFQLSDDILDEVSTAEKLGKTPGKDKRDKKTTLVSLWGMEKSIQMVEHYLSECLIALSPFGDKAQDLREIARFVAKRDF